MSEFTNINISHKLLIERSNYIRVHVSKHLEDFAPKLQQKLDTKDDVALRFAHYHAQVGRSELGWPQSTYIHSDKNRRIILAKMSHHFKGETSRKNLRIFGINFSEISERYSRKKKQGGNGLI